MTHENKITTFETEYGPILFDPLNYKVLTSFGHVVKLDTFNGDYYFTMVLRKFDLDINCKITLNPIKLYIMNSKNYQWEGV